MIGYSVVIRLVDLLQPDNRKIDCPPLHAKRYRTFRDDLFINFPNELYI